MFRIAMIGILLLLCGCTLAGSDQSRFAELEKRYLENRPVWALEIVETHSYDAALSGLRKGLSNSTESGRVLAQSVEWRQTTLAANLALREAVQRRALLNPVDEDCRQSGRLKKAIEESARAIEKLSEAQAGAQALAKNSASNGPRFADEEKTIAILLESEAEELARLKKIEQYACEKKFG